MTEMTNIVEQGVPEEPEVYTHTPNDNSYLRELCVKKEDYDKLLADFRAMQARLDTALLDVEGYKAGECAQAQRAEEAERKVAVLASAVRFADREKSFGCNCDTGILSHGKAHDNDCTTVEYADALAIARAKGE